MNQNSSIIRILYINGWSTVRGGSSTSLLDIVSSLDRSRFDPIVLCPNSGPLPERLEEINVPVVIRKFSPLTRSKIFSFLRETLGYFRFLKREKIALIHANTSCWRRSIILAARWLKIPFVQHVRNEMKDLDSDFSLTYAKRIIVNSKYTGRAFLKHENLKSKVQTIYNSFDLSLYEAEDDRREEIQAGDRPIIGFVGQIIPRKGVLTLIQAMPLVLKQSKHALLIIVGRAPADEPDYEKECRALVEKLGIQENVHFTGLRKDVPAWMRTFNVFALPTRAEPFGKVIVEAMAACCPVVATRVGGIPEIISGPELGTLIDPDDPEAIAKEILQYLMNPDRTKKIVSHAHEYALKNFTLTKMMNNLMTMYETILKS